jgi:hypothetical protein
VCNQDSSRAPAKNQKPLEVKPRNQQNQSDNPEKPAVNYAYSNKYDQSADTLLVRNLRAGNLFGLYRRNPGVCPGFKQAPAKN